MARPALRESLKILLRELLPSGYPSIEVCAQRLGVPVRTLQRHLAADGLTYSQLVAQVRLEMACRLLDHPQISIATVAGALGYADPSNFRRAFLRWTGMPPRDYRRLRSDDPPGGPSGQVAPDGTK